MGEMGRGMPHKVSNPETPQLVLVAVREVNSRAHGREQEIDGKVQKVGTNEAEQQHLNLPPAVAVMSPAILVDAVEIVQAHVNDERIAPNVIAEVKQLQDLSHTASKEAVGAYPVALICPQSQLAFRKESSQERLVQIQQR